MANSLDQIFRNFINRITGGDTEENVAETKPDQGGLMAPRIVRPKARPEDVEPIGGVATGAASTGNIALKRFVDGLNEATKLDVSLRPKARPLQNTLIDPNLSADTLQQKHNMPLYKFQQENSVASDDGSTVKVFSAPTSDAAVDEIVMRAESLFEKIIRPKARPLTRDQEIERINKIRKEQRSYTEIDSTKDLQVALNAAGIRVNGKPLAEDGIMGPLTKKAIRAFQKDKGLKVDGIAGPITKQALYGVTPQPEITEEVLPESEGLMSKRTFKVEDVKEASILGGLVNLLGNLGLGTSEFRFFAGNLINPGSTKTENSLNKSDIKALRSAVSTSMQDNRSYTTYEDFGFDEMEVNKYSALSGIVDPDLRMARSVGVFNFDVDDKGNVFIKDTFDFNPGPKRIAYYEALKKGNKKDALAMLADASPVQAASMVGYAKQESLKEENKPYQTQININLGNPDTWT
jgi:peptidoglycan hydrolase-like protein with peptidoglycan-binding domain